MKAASSQDRLATSTEATAPARPARGRKMNSNPVASPTINNFQPKTTLKTQPQTKGKAKAKVEDDAKSVASYVNGWGRVSRDPWGGASVGASSVKDDREADSDGDDARSVAASSVNGWSRVSRGPWGGASVGAPSVKDDRDDEDARSVAASSAGGWGNVSRGPWGGASVGTPSVKDDREDESDEDDARTVNGSESGRRGRSWADQMDDEDNRSVAASEASGASWGQVCNGPWK